jgi:prolipoprotein diacylglyceryltransferase
LSSWWLIRSVRRTSDRVAAFLFGVFYAIRIATEFGRNVDASAPMIAACAVISLGMMAMLVGLIRALSHAEPADPETANQS